MSKQEVEDYGIGQTEMRTEIETKLSPKLYLQEHGVYVMTACKCQGCNELGDYEIRFDPTVLELMDNLDGYVINSESKAEKMRNVYESIFNQREYDFWAFQKAKIPARFSKKTDVNIMASCENLEGIEDVVSEKSLDYFTAIENGYVLRLLYSSAEDCFADFKKIFEEMYESYFRDTIVRCEFKNVDEVNIEEIVGHWTSEVDDASDEEAPQK